MIFIILPCSIAPYFCPVSNMQNSLKALVLTYKTAPVAVREQVSLNETGAKKLLNFLRENRFLRRFFKLS